MARKRKRSIFRDRVANNSHKQKTQSSSYGYLQIPKGVDIFKEEPSTRVFLDFLPYRVTSERHMDRDDSLGIAVPGELWYKRPFLIHRNIGGGNDAVVCPTSVGKKCPICEYRAKLFKEGSASKEETDALKVSRRNLYVVVPIGHKEYEEKPHIWDISQYLFQDMLNDEIEDDPENAVFPDLEEGLTLRIRFGEGSIGSNRFAETSRIDFRERKRGYDEEILEEVPNLDECLLIHPYEKLERMFLELEDEEEVMDEGPSEPGPELEEDEQMEEEDLDGMSRRELLDFARDRGIRIRGAKTMPLKRLRRTIKEELEDLGEAEEGKVEKVPEGKKEKEENPCPYGHVFGADCEKFPECDECDKWDECIDAQDIPF